MSTRNYAKERFRASWVRLETTLRALDDVQTSERLLVQATIILTQITGRLEARLAGERVT